MPPTDPSIWAVWAREGDEARTYWARGEWGPYASFRNPTRRAVVMEDGGTYKQTETGSNQCQQI